MPVCPICNEAFVNKRRPPKKCCSVKCRQEALKKYYEFDCKVCKKPCKHTAKQSRLYCSEECEKQDNIPVTKEILTAAMIQYRFGSLPHWSLISKHLKRSHHTIRKLVKQFGLVDKKNNGPVVDGQLVYIPKNELIKPELISKERLEKRILEKREIGEDGCWIWGGSWDKRGYGYMYVSRPYDRFVLVKVIAAYVWLDIPIEEKKNIVHKCKCRACFNPDHFIICKTKKRMYSVFSKSKCTGRKGEKHSKAKINLVTALDIRDGIIWGETNKEIRDRLGVNIRIISAIRRKRSWTHIWKMKHEYA